MRTANQMSNQVSGSRPCQSGGAVKPPSYLASKSLGVISIALLGHATVRRNPTAGFLGVVVGAASVLCWRVEVFNRKRLRYKELFKLSSEVTHDPADLFVATDDRPDVIPGQPNCERPVRSVFKRTDRLERRRVRHVIAASFAAKAYVQFGPRARSPANVLVTRKYLRDYIREHKPTDLRYADIGPITDVAVHLSFYPSADHLEVLDMSATGLSNVYMGAGGGSTRLERRELCSEGDGIVARVVEYLTPAPGPGPGA